MAEITTHDGRCRKEGRTGQQDYTPRTWHGKGEYVLPGDRVSSMEGKLPAGGRGRHSER